MAAWEEGEKTIQKAKLFSGGAFVLLLLLAVYSAYLGDTFSAAYFAVFSLISLVLFIYVRRAFKTPLS